MSKAWAIPEDPAFLHCVLQRYKIDLTGKVWLYVFSDLQCQSGFATSTWPDDSNTSAVWIKKIRTKIPHAPALVR